MSNNQGENLNMTDYNSKLYPRKISEVEDVDNLNLVKKNHDFDINDNSNNKSQQQTELSTIIDNSSSNINEDDQLDKEIDLNDKNKLENPIIREEQNSFNGSLFYGNNINDLKPKRIGNLFAFFYINQKPLIVIGPDCKQILFMIFYFCR